MGVNLSNHQIAQELGLCESDVQAMAEVLRHGIVAKTPDVVLSGDVEFDELYVVAGHKGKPEAVRAKGRDGRRNRLKRGRGTLEKEKPPIFGMIERGGQVVIRMLVQQATIHPIIEKPKARTSIPTSIASTPSFLVSATATRPSVMVEANTPATRTVMGSARSTLTPSRASGHSFDPGASWHLSGEAAALSRLLPVRSQCSQTGKGFARLLDRGAGRLSPLPITPKPDKSLKVLDFALGLAPPNSPVRIDRLGGLANALRVRWLQLRNVEDLERMHLLYEEAVRQSRSGSPSRAGHLANLAVADLDRYIAYGKANDFDRAKFHADEAASECPERSSDRLKIEEIQRHISLIHTK